MDRHDLKLRCHGGTFHRAAAAPIKAGRVVIAVPTEHGPLMRHAMRDDLLYHFPVSIALHDANTSQAVELALEETTVHNPEWSWEAGSPILWVGDDGEMTHEPRPGVFPIAYAFTTTSVRLLNLDDRRKHMVSVSDT